MPGFEEIGKEELNQVTDLFRNSGILFRHSFDAQRNGIYKVREFEQKFAHKFGVEDALAVSSGSAALRVGLGALGIGCGDEVITQAFTFVATVEAIVEAGAQPVIAEIDDTLNMCAEDLEKKITSKTKAVIVVHMLGVPANMKAIMKVANRHKIKVIEDTAWGCGALNNGRYLGTIGDVGTFSFDFAKLITTGEGGMVVCRRKDVLEKARAYHDHGHENNPKLPRWEDSRSASGFNYRMGEMQGAVGCAQISKLDKIIKSHLKNWNRLKNIIQENSHFKIRNIPPDCTHTGDAMIFYTSSLRESRKCREILLKEGVSTKILPEAISWHFAGTWKHIVSLKKRYKNLSSAFKKSSAILDKCVSLPVQVKMKSSFFQAVERVIKRIGSE